MALSYSSISGSSSGPASNDFTISLGSNGYTRTSLSASFPAGSYTISSSLSDDTYDIYLISEDGTNAGYVNAANATSTISATKSFNAIVIYGGSNNDTISFVFEYVFSPSSQSTTDFLGAPPKLSSISVNSLPNQDNTTTITGANFANDVTVTFTGSDNVPRNAKSIVRSSSTELIVTRPDSMPTEYSPYTITASNPGITNPTSTNSHKLINSITVGNAPIWVTSAILPSYRKDESYSQTVSATDADGGSTITYTYVSGSLPSEITFNTSTATFSGTPTTNANSPYSYTIRATDSGNNYVDRTFTVQQLVPDAPTIGTATDVGTSRSFNNGEAVVTFTPANTGPAATSYTVTAYLNGSSTNINASGASSPITVTGLLSNTNYTFLVKAVNASGDSLNSSQTSSILITTVPQTPTIGTPTATNTTTVSLPFTAGGTGGKTITSYTVISSPSISLSVSGTSSPLTVTGSYATNTPYTFTIAAVNANGTSVASSSSSSVTPVTIYQLSATYNSSGTYTVPSGITKVAVIGVAGGGGGAGADGWGTPGSRSGTGGLGGGSGARFLVHEIPVSPGQTYNISVGAGGNGGAQGQQFANIWDNNQVDGRGKAGNGGGATSFGNIVVSNGGGGGVLTGNNSSGTTDGASGGSLTVNAGIAISNSASGASGGGVSRDYYSANANAKNYNPNPNYPTAGGAGTTLSYNDGNISSLTVGGGGGGGGHFFYASSNETTQTGGRMFGGAGGGGGGTGGNTGTLNSGTPNQGGAGGNSSTIGGGGGGGGAGARAFNGSISAGNAGGAGSAGRIIVYGKG